MLFSLKYKQKTRSLWFIIQTECQHTTHMQPINSVSQCTCQPCLLIENTFEFI